MQLIALVEQTLITTTICKCKLLAYRSAGAVPLPYNFSCFKLSNQNGSQAADLVTSIA